VAIMTADGGQDSALTLAARRLEQAAARLEQRLAARLAEVETHAGGAFDQDRARLAADLDAARARERELQDAGAHASAALSRAIGEIRAALGEGTP
jgi:hypothetical protein